MKEQATEELVRAIQTVLAGEMYVSAKVRAQAVRRMLTSQPRGKNGAASELAALTNRELQVFKAIGSGKTNKQIAGEMDLSVKTIETYREHIKYKLNLVSGAELVARARQAMEA
jgi:DNA-binding NarL/FixJ family response regulator